MIRLIQYRWGMPRPDRRRAKKATQYVQTVHGEEPHTEPSVRQRIRQNHLFLNDGPAPGPFHT